MINCHELGEGPDDIVSTSALNVDAYCVGWPRAIVVVDIDDDKQLCGFSIVEGEAWLDS